MTDRACLVLLLFSVIMLAYSMGRLSVILEIDEAYNALEAWEKEYRTQHQDRGAPREKSKAGESDCASCGGDIA